MTRSRKKRAQRNRKHRDPNADLLESSEDEDRIKGSLTPDSYWRELRYQTYLKTRMRENMHRHSTKVVDDSGRKVTLAERIVRFRIEQPKHEPDKTEPNVSSEENEKGHKLRDLLQQYIQQRHAEEVLSSELLEKINVVKVSLQDDDILSNPSTSRGRKSYSIISLGDSATNFNYKIKDRCVRHDEDDDDDHSEQDNDVRIVEGNYVGSPNEHRHNVTEEVQRHDINTKELTHDLDNKEKETVKETESRIDKHVRTVNLTTNNVEVETEDTGVLVLQPVTNISEESSACASQSMDDVRPLDTRIGDTVMIYDKEQDELDEINEKEKTETCITQGEGDNLGSMENGNIGKDVNKCNSTGVENLIITDETHEINKNIATDAERDLEKDTINSTSEDTHVLNKDNEYKSCQPANESNETLIKDKTISEFEQEQSQNSNEKHFGEGLNNPTAHITDTEIKVDHNKRLHDESLDDFDSGVVCDTVTHPHLENHLDKTDDRSNTFIVTDKDSNRLERYPIEESEDIVNQTSCHSSEGSDWIAESHASPISVMGGHEDKGEIDPFNLSANQGGQNDPENSMFLSNIPMCLAQERTQTSLNDTPVLRSPTAMGIDYDDAMSDREIRSYDGRSSDIESESCDRLYSIERGVSLPPLCHGNGQLVSSRSTSFLYEHMKFRRIGKYKHRKSLEKSSFLSYLDHEDNNFRFPLIETKQILNHDGGSLPKMDSEISLPNLLQQTHLSQLGSLKPKCDSWDCNQRGKYYNGHLPELPCYSYHMLNNSQYGRSKIQNGTRISQQEYVGQGTEERTQRVADLYRKLNYFGMPQCHNQDPSSSCYLKMHMEWGFMDVPHCSRKRQERYSMQNKLCTPSFPNQLQHLPNQQCSSNQISKRSKCDFIYLRDVSFGHFILKSMSKKDNVSDYLGPLVENTNAQTDTTKVHRKSKWGKAHTAFLQRAHRSNGTSSLSAMKSRQTTENKKGVR